MNRLLWALVAIAIAVPVRAEKLVASEIPGVGIKAEGKIVIRNDGKMLRAWQFDGDIRKALISLRSGRTLVYRPYGAVVYDSSAPMPDLNDARIELYIRDAAQTHGVDPRLVTAIARRESAFNPRAVSRVGAQGIMQLMPATADFLGVNDPFDPAENIRGGVRYLRMLLDTFRGDLDLALAAYNAGPGAVERWGGVPPYNETIAYVAAVRRTYEQSLRNRS